MLYDDDLGLLVQRLQHCLQLLPACIIPILPHTMPKAQCVIPAGTALCSKDSQWPQWMLNADWEKAGGLQSTTSSLS